MAIATTAITATTTIPPVWPCISHRLFSLRQAPELSHYPRFPRRACRYCLKPSSGMAAFWDIAWNREPWKPAFAWFLSLEINFNDSKISFLLKFRDLNSTRTFHNDVSTVACCASFSFLKLVYYIIAVLWPREKSQCKTDVALEEVACLLIFIPSFIQFPLDQQLCFKL